MKADKLRGSYICGEGDRQGLRRDLAGAQTFDPSTREAVEGRFRRHVYPQLGGRQLRQVRLSTSQAWLRGLELADSTTKVVFANLSTLFAAAVNHELIVRNLCRSPSVRRPRAEQRKVIPVDGRQGAGRRRRTTRAVPDHRRARRRPRVAPGRDHGPLPRRHRLPGKEIRVVRQVTLIGARRLFAPP